MCVYPQLQNFIIDFMLTIVLAYLFYCIIECPVVNLLNLAQGKIFYDVEHYKPRQNELRVQADLNGNGHVSKEPEPEATNDDMLAYPPNIVIHQELSSATEVKQPNEFEMSPQTSGETNNNSESLEEGSTSEIATSRL